jgi:tRNA(Arg) A34 adenosine deaminase TadA
MATALEEAKLALSQGEVPVGAVAVYQGKIIARAHNQREQLNDPSAHAEILVLREAGKVLGSWNLSGVDIYVTLEPCPMCAGAIVNSRVDTVIYGASDPKGGAVRSLYALCEDPRLNHSLKVVHSILKDESADILSQFFQELRKK